MGVVVAHVLSVEECLMVYGGCQCRCKDIPAKEVIGFFTKCGHTIANTGCYLLLQPPYFPNDNTRIVGYEERDVGLTVDVLTCANVCVTAGGKILNCL